MLFCLTSFGQKKLKPIGDYLRKDSIITIKNFTGVQIDESVYKVTDKFLQINIKDVLEVSGNWDTVTITTPRIKFIKVDGKIYEIKRTTELKEIVDNYGFKGSFPNTTWYIDTSYYTPKIKQ